MARAQTNDFFHNFKFQVYTASAAVMPISEGGFSTCTLPEMTADIIEYKEGIYLYKRKFPGNPTISDVSLTRGVAKARSSLYGWIRACVEGKEYRTDVTIQHFHRDDWGSFGDPEAFDGNKAASRQVILKQAWCPRYKPGSDFDSQGAEVSIEELDICCESFEVQKEGGAILSDPVAISN